MTPEEMKKRTKQLALRVIRLQIADLKSTAETTESLLR